MTETARSAAHDHGTHDHAGTTTEHGHGHGGHGGHDHGDHIKQFRERFWWNLLLAIPVVAFSEMFADLIGYTRPSGTAWISPVLGTIIFFYGGWPFLSGGVSEVRARQPGMMLLIALAITVAFTASLATSLGIGNLDLDFWWELALLVVIMLLGHWLEMKAIGQAQGALAALAELLPDVAERVTGDGVESVPLAELQPGDVVLVRPGARVPADGVIVEGEAELDESMITGESRPVAEAAGRPRGRRNGHHRLRHSRARRRGGRRHRARPGSSGSSRKRRRPARVRRRSPTAPPRWLFYVAAGAGIVTFVVWMLVGDADEAVEHTVTVLVIACPHALGLAIPLVIALSTAVAARAGILVKDRLALERMREINAVLFDKTGTLTRGQHVVTDVAVADDAGVSDDELLALAGAVESDSEHPLARAIVDRGARAARCRRRATSARSPDGVSKPSSTAVVVAVGGPALLRERGSRVPTTSRRRSTTGRRAALRCSPSCAADAVIGALALEDEVRPESRDGGPRPARPRDPGGDDHGRRAAGRRSGRPRRRRRRGARRGAPRRQGHEGRRAPGARAARRDGRRRRERRARARTRRRRHRHRRGHRRRDRVCRCRARVVGPAGRASA